MRAEKVYNYKSGLRDEGEESRIHFLPRPFYYDCRANVRALCKAPIIVIISWLTAIWPNEKAIHISLKSYSPPSQCVRVIRSPRGHFLDVRMNSPHLELTKCISMSSHSWADLLLCKRMYPVTTVLLQLQLMKPNLKFYLASCRQRCRVVSASDTQSNGTKFEYLVLDFVKT